MLHALAVYDSILHSYSIAEGREDGHSLLYALQYSDDLSTGCCDDVAFRATFLFGKLRSSKLKGRF